MFGLPFNYRDNVSLDFIASTYTETMPFFGVNASISLQILGNGRLTIYGENDASGGTYYFFDEPWIYPTDYNFARNYEVLVSNVTGSIGLGGPIDSWQPISALPSDGSSAYTWSISSIYPDSGSAEFIISIRKVDSNLTTTSVPVQFTLTT